MYEDCFPFFLADPQVCVLWKDYEVRPVRSFIQKVLFRQNIVSCRSLVFIHIGYGCIPEYFCCAPTISCANVFYWTAGCNIYSSGERQRSLSGPRKTIQLLHLRSHKKCSSKTQNFSLEVSLGPRRRRWKKSPVYHRSLFRETMGNVPSPNSSFFDSKTKYSLSFVCFQQSFSRTSGTSFCLLTAASGNSCFSA